MDELARGVSVTVSKEHVICAPATFLRIGKESCGYKQDRSLHLHRVQELCESRGGCPGLPVLMSLMVSVDVKHWSQFVPNMSTDIRGHEVLHHHPSPLRAQELCESRGGRPGLPSLISLRFLGT